jgi:hypothetical protein
MMLILHVALAYTSLALAYPSPSSPIIDPTEQKQSVPETHQHQSSPREGHHAAGDGVPQHLAAVLDALTAKSRPSTAEDKASLPASPDDASSDRAWNKTTQQLKSILEKLSSSSITTQNGAGAQHLPPATQRDLHALSTAFTDLLPAAARSAAENPQSPGRPSTSTLSANTTNFIYMQGSMAPLVPILALINLSMLSNSSTGRFTYSSEIAKYISELALLRTAWQRTSAPVPYTAGQCREGVVASMAEVAAHPVAANKLLRTAVAGGVVLALAGLGTGMLLMAWDTGPEGVARMTHMALREWTALANGDAASCANVTMMAGRGGGGMGRRWVHVDAGKVQDEVVRDPAAFISDALASSRGLQADGMMGTQKSKEDGEAWSSRWMDFAVGLPDALASEYQQLGREGFLDKVTPTESLQRRRVPSDFTVDTA